MIGIVFYHFFSQDATMTLVLRRLEEPSADTNGLTAYRPRSCLFHNRGLAFPSVSIFYEFNFLKNSNIEATNLFLDVHNLKNNLVLMSLSVFPSDVGDVGGLSHHLLVQAAAS